MIVSLPENNFSYGFLTLTLLFGPFWSIRVQNLIFSIQNDLGYLKKWKSYSWSVIKLFLISKRYSNFSLNIMPRGMKIFLYFGTYSDYSMYSEYFQIFSRGFRLFIFIIFRKISSDYSEYNQIFGIFSDIRPKIPIIQV